MTHFPSIDAIAADQFLWAQRFRHPATHKNYANILRNFNRFLANRCATASLDISTVQQ